jgi:hypothetical protein
LTQWWVGTASGDVYALDANGQELTPLWQLAAPIADLAVLDGTLYVAAGTQVIAAQGGIDPLTTATPISTLSAITGGQLAISTTDRLLITDRNLAVRSETPLNRPATHIAQHPNDGWLALTDGQCAISRVDLDNPTNVTPLINTTSHSIVFVGDQLWHIEDGRAVAVGANSLNMANPLQAPYNPHPPDRSSPMTALRLDWEPAPSPCLPYRYELVINGQPVATLDAPTYPFTTPPTGRTRWQVTLLLPDGQRIPGPEWRFESPAQGWAGQPQQVRVDFIETDDASALGVSPLIIGGSLIGIGIVLGMGVLRWASRRPTPAPEENKNEA